MRIYTVAIHTTFHYRERMHDSCSRMECVVHGSVPPHDPHRTDPLHATELDRVCQAYERDSFCQVDESCRNLFSAASAMCRSEVVRLFHRNTRYVSAAAPQQYVHHPREHTWQTRTNTRMTPGRLIVAARNLIRTCGEHKGWHAVATRVASKQNRRTQESGLTSRDDNPLSTYLT